MNGEDLANKAGLNRTNRFIFSDSYYEKMPEVPGRPTFDPVVPLKKEQDLSKEVMDAEKQLLSQANYHSSETSNDLLDNPFDSGVSVQQASSLDQVLQNDYSSASSSSNGLDFFSHQVNTVVSDSDLDLNRNDGVPNTNDFDLDRNGGISSTNDFDSNSASSNIDIPMQEGNFFDMFTTQRKQDNPANSSSFEETQAFNSGIESPETSVEPSPFSADINEKVGVHSDPQLNNEPGSNLPDSNSNSTTFDGSQNEDNHLELKNSFYSSIGNDFDFHLNRDSVAGTLDTYNSNESFLDHGFSSSFGETQKVGQENDIESEAVDVYDFGERPANSLPSTKRHILYSNDGKGSYDYSLGTLKSTDEDQFDVFDIRRDSEKISASSIGNIPSPSSTISISNDDKKKETSSTQDGTSSSLNDDINSDYTFGISNNPFADIEKDQISKFSNQRTSLASIEKELANGDETVDFIQKLKDQDSTNGIEVDSTASSFDPSFGTPVQEKKDFLWEVKKETPIEEIKIPERKLEYDSHFGAPSIPEERKFIVNGDPSVEVAPRKMDSTKIPDFMAGTIRTNDLNIETGVNHELEAELLRKRNEEEEQRRLENSEYLAYQSLIAQVPTKKMVYKAGGKSYIRDVVKKPKPASALELASNDATPVLPIEETEESSESLVVDVNDKRTEPKSIEELIEGIVGVPGLYNLEVKLNPFENPGVKFGFKEKEEKKVVSDDQPTTVYDEKKDNFDYDQNFDNVEVIKSNLLDELIESTRKEGRISVLARYGEDFCARDYITNPAIGRADEIKQLILILLTPEKSGILIGKPGIGKTSIVEGLAYQLQRNNVPDALKGYRIVSVKTSSLLGSLPTGETRLQTLVDELKELDKIILFIDEIHMLVGATSESALDFANMFKESLGRGSIKVIGATTTEEYERYILRDKAFVRRFQKVEVEEPNREQTIKILLGTLPKIEKVTGAKLKYTQFIQSEIMSFIVDITTEYKRIYGIGSRYPDICLTLLSQAFSQAVFANRVEVTIHDIRKAIQNSKNIYPDVIRKELVNFDRKFKDLIREEEQGK